MTAGSVVEERQGEYLLTTDPVRVDVRLHAETARSHVVQHLVERAPQGLELGVGKSVGRSCQVLVNDDVTAYEPCPGPDRGKVVEQTAIQLAAHVEIPF